MTIEQQAALIQETDVLVGVHGAGLTHLIELPRGASVVEITPSPPPLPIRSVANIFSNLAQWTNHPYRSIRALGTLDSPELSVDTDDVVRAVQDLLRASPSAL
mmetsp:Transcript_104358/g.212847  ORF Transcript_104358/g.212847 Transcript_104358/m.212847 type:complete len:103 (-) Transcript_104358:142-450(-)